MIPDRAACGIAHLVAIVRMDTFEVDAAGHLDFARREPEDPIALVRPAAGVVIQVVERQQIHLPASHAGDVLRRQQVHAALTELFFSLPALRHISTGREHLDEPAIGVEDPTVGPLLPAPAIPYQRHMLLRELGICRCHHCHLALNSLAIFGSDERQEARPDAILLAHTERAAVAVVDERPCPVRPPLDDELGLVLDDETIPLFASLKQFVCVFAFGEIAEDDECTISETPHEHFEVANAPVPAGDLGGHRRNRMAAGAPGLGDRVVP